ncbi:hypothetical protein ACIQWA_07250 [Kitasatospora sp. NPDC098652]|uniref:hypothetical protein n=1 Tax=Kitasatospora sp. NPDC098652 TaxID=3364095 RepID=UPI00380C5A12
MLRASGAQLGSNLFDFDEHATVPRPGFVHTVHALADLDHDGELNPEPLRHAIARYIDVFTDSPPAPATAESRTESRVRGVQRGAAQPPAAPTGPSTTPAHLRAAAARGR